MKQIQVVQQIKLELELVPIDSGKQSRATINKMTVDEYADGGAGMTSMPADHDVYRAGALKLRSCAYCGGPATLGHLPGAKTWWRVRCNDYYCGGTTWAMEEQEWAVNAWNRRPDVEA